MGVNGRLKLRDQKFALEMEFHWQIAVELDEKFILGHHFPFSNPSIIVPLITFGVGRNGDTLTVAHSITVAGRA
jgi:hypothetical protein